jgi:hypothetical protein
MVRIYGVFGMPSLFQRAKTHSLPLVLCALLVIPFLGIGCKGKSKTESKKTSDKTKTTVAKKSSSKSPIKKTVVKKTEKTVVAKTTSKKTGKKTTIELTPEQKAFADAVKELIEIGAVIKHNETTNEITHVDFSGAESKNSHFALLKNFPNLRNVNATFQENISDEGIKHLESLQYLTELYLYGTKLTDKGMVTVGKFDRLGKLCLDQTQITDAGLKHLRGLPELKILHIRSKGKITDEGVSDIVKIKSLRELKIGGTQITATGKKKLRILLPRCVVDTSLPGSGGG